MNNLGGGYRGKTMENGERERTQRKGKKTEKGKEGRGRETLIRRFFDRRIKTKRKNHRGFKSFITNDSRGKKGKMTRGETKTK
jgi:hypothetical protein